MQALHTLAVFSAGGNDVDARGIDAAVAENVGELGDVLFRTVERPREQVAEIVRKDFAWADVRVCAKGFHLSPKIRAAERLARPRNKDCPCCDMPFLGVVQQLFLQFPYKEHRAHLAFAFDRCLSRPRSFYCDELQLAHADTRPADRLKNQVQAVVFLLPRDVQQPNVFSFGQFFFLAAKDLSLTVDLFHAAVVPAKESEQAVDARQHGIDAHRCIAGIEQLLLERYGKLFGDRAPIQKRGEYPYIADVFFDGVWALFVGNEVLFKLFEMGVG